MNYIVEYFREYRVETPKDVKDFSFLYPEVKETRRSRRLSAEIWKLHKDFKERLEVKNLNDASRNMQANHPVLRVRRLINSVKEHVYKLKNKPSGVIRLKEPFFLFLVYHFFGKRTFVTFDSTDNKEKLVQKIEGLIK
ncbi:MAG: hypothetical protein ACE5K4_11485 [Candidatus Hydrothermarchaeota archaeon]